MSNIAREIVHVQRMVIILHGITISPFSIPKLRGDIASQYPQFTLIHNHLENENLRYGYPSIQFKVIDKKPMIIGIQDGIEVLKQVFMKLEDVKIEGDKIEIHEKSIQLDVLRFGQTSDYKSYKLSLPWMALNQKNHQEYKTLNWHEKRTFLERILRGNLISLSKGLDYTIPSIDNIFVQSDLKPVIRNFKNQKMLCFTGTFRTNFEIPDYLGIGKQTARGFGTVVHQ
ncbi:MAG: hypothetical protein ISS11_07710 [Candidatus Marinimicrobia bacterium]|nr:hypothetical protein [Candidatus Neomarinimicrobiota bacterium]